MISIGLKLTIQRIRTELKRIKTSPDYAEEPTPENKRIQLIISLRKMFPATYKMSSKIIEHTWRHRILEALLGYSIETQDNLPFAITLYLIKVTNGSSYFTEMLASELEALLEVEYDGIAWAILEPDAVYLGLRSLRDRNNKTNDDGSARSLDSEIGHSVSANGDSSLHQPSV